MSTLSSLTNHLEVLKEKHLLLDKKCTEDFKNRLNSDEYNAEKKQKLMLKQEITALEQIIQLKKKQEVLNEDVNK
tara:strand:- start:263 stop:487 length:225 start_codon:yes stop_codon:yes gene_type:complete